MKKFLPIILSLIFILSTISNVFALENVNVTLNGEKIELLAEPIVIDDSILIQIRPVVEALGADIYWYEAEELVVIVKNEVKIFFVIENDFFNIFVGDTFWDLFSYDAEIDYFTTYNPPIIVNGSAFVEIETIVEILGANIYFNQETNILEITADNEIIASQNQDKDFFNDFLEYIVAYEKYEDFLDYFIDYFFDDEALEWNDFLTEWYYDSLEKLFPDYDFSGMFDGVSLALIEEFLDAFLDEIEHRGIENFSPEDVSHALIEVIKLFENIDSIKQLIQNAETLAEESFLIVDKLWQKSF